MGIFDRWNSIRPRLRQAMVFMALLALCSVPFNEHQWPLRYSGLSVILLGVCSLLSADFKAKGRRLVQEPLAWAWPAYFGLVLLGLLWTQNMAEGGVVVELRIICLIVPLALFSEPPFSPRHLEFVRRVLTVVGFAACLFSFRFGFAYFSQGLYHQDETLHQPFYVHRNYLSLLLLFLVAWNVAKFRHMPSYWERAAAVLVGLFFLWFAWQAKSRGPLLFGALALLVFLPLYLARMAHLKSALALVAFYIGLALALWSSSQQLRFFADKIVHLQPVEPSAQKQAAWMYSVDERTAIWNFCREVLKEPGVFWFGTGTGDMQDRLNHHYCLVNEYWCEQIYNPHNQYLMVWMRWGFMAMVAFFVGLFLWPMVHSLQRKNWLALYFLLFVAFNLLTEAYLNREAGLMLVVVLWCLLLREASPAKS